MKKLLVLAVACTMLAVSVNAQAESRRGNGFWAERVDIYDIFVRSWMPVDLGEEEIQFFIDELPDCAEVFMSMSPTGIKTFAYLSPRKFGCIAKLLPTPTGAYSQMLIENCQFSRFRLSGRAASNRTHHIVTKPNGAVVEFDSTVTWAFHYEDGMQATTQDGSSYTGVWLIDMLIVNDNGPAMVQYTTVEDVGIVGKRAAVVTWP